MTEDKGQSNYYLFTRIVTIGFEAPHKSPFLLPYHQLAWNLTFETRPFKLGEWSVFQDPPFYVERFQCVNWWEGAPMITLLGLNTSQSLFQLLRLHQKENGPSSRTPPPPPHYVEHFHVQGGRVVPPLRCFLFHQLHCSWIVFLFCCFSCLVLFIFTGLQKAKSCLPAHTSRDGQDWSQLRSSAEVAAFAEPRPQVKRLGLGGHVTWCPLKQNDQVVFVGVHVCCVHVCFFGVHVFVFFGQGCGITRGFSNHFCDIFGNRRE